MRISDFFHHTIVTRTCRTWFPSCFYDFLHFPANNCLLIRLLTDSILFYMHSHWIFFINVPHTETHHINWKKFSKNKGQKERAREKNWQLSLTTIQKVTKTKRDHTNRACWFYVPLISLFSILFFLNENHKVKCRFHCFDVEQRMEDISDKSMVVRAKIGKHKIGKGNKQLAVAELSTAPQKADAEQHR